MTEGVRVEESGMTTGLALVLDSTTISNPLGRVTWPEPSPGVSLHEKCSLLCLAGVALQWCYVGAYKPSSAHTV